MGCLVGTNGTGKSTYLKEFINSEKNKDIIYISPYIDAPTKEYNILFIKPLDFFNVDFELLKDSLIIFDDCKSYISTNILENNTKILNNLLIQRRFLNIELYFSFHSFAQIPTFLYDYFTKIIIKKTTDNLQKLKNRMLFFDEILETQSVVNANKNNYFYKILNLR